ncbi:MAG: hypothetical protein EYC68_03260 [Chloroflexota bacterium]|nr:MAG: hypothetical protein EYC68_03260 [Chloroflexota bacterium]
MTVKMGSVHEPEAELLGVEDALGDVARLEEHVFQQPDRVVAVRVELSALIDALDQLNLDELRQVSQYVQKRLAAHTTA